MLGIRKTLVRVALGALLLSGSAFATNYICPSINGITGVHAVGTYSTFCVDSYGGVNAWNNDLFSVSGNLMGASGVWLGYHYDLGGGNNGWITDWLALSLGPNSTSSGFSPDLGASNGGTAQDCTLGGNTCIGAPVGSLPAGVTPLVESTVKDTNMSVQIDSAVVDNRLKQIYQITVTGLGTGGVNSYQAAEYFQFYPYLNDQDNSGASLLVGTVRTIENTFDTGLVAGGGAGSVGAAACGGWAGASTYTCANPDSWDLKSTASTVQSDVGSNTDGQGTNYNNANGPISYPSGAASNNAPAGALLYKVNLVTSSNSQTFVVELVPEPETWTLLAVGATLCLFSRRRKEA